MLSATILDSKNAIRRLRSHLDWVVTQSIITRVEVRAAVQNHSRQIMSKRKQTDEEEEELGSETESVCRCSFQSLGNDLPKNYSVESHPG
jgi:hypothetical protein